MCVQNLKFLALPVPENEIKGGTQKIWAVPGYAHAPFSPKFLRGFSSDGPSEILPNLKFVGLRVPEIIGVLKKGPSLDTHTPPFLPNFHGLVVGWTL